MNRDIDRYKELHDLAEDFARAIVTNEESASVKEFFAQKQITESLKKKLEDASDFEEIYRKVENRNKEHDVLMLEQRIKDINQRKLKRNRLKRIIISASASVAAALIVISFVIYDIGKPDIVSIAPEYIEHIEDDKIKIIQSNGDVQVLNQKKHIAVNGINIAEADDERIKYNSGTIDSAVMTTIVIPKTTRYTVMLEDGSEVHLSANSTLKYPSRFAESKREVELTGEAYFKVAKNNKPFYVKASGIEVKVYGTEFNINSYNRSKIETTLLFGSVGVRYPSRQLMQEVRITPNQRITVNQEKGTVSLENSVNIQKYISWNDGFFRSDEEPLNLLLKDIANWYDVEFVFENEAICDKLVSASLNSNMPIDNLIKMLEISTNIKIIKTEGGKYIIK